MKSTLKQQVKVASKIFNQLHQQRKTLGIDKRTLNVLNDAVATLCSIQMLGESLVTNSGELLQAAKSCNREFDDVIDSIEAFAKLTRAIAKCEGKALPKKVGYLK